MLKVAMLSGWHVHAKGYAQEIQENPNACVSCIWDEDPIRGAQWAKERKVDFEPCLDRLLAREDVDAVAICTPTHLHTEVIMKAAAAKKHIFTEKVLTLTAKDALKVKKAIEDNGVIFTISMPQRTVPVHLFAKKLVEEKTLGDINMMRVRNGHNGATANWLPNYWYDPVTTGGGAMMDLGAHPMYLANWLFGKAHSISSCFGHYTHRMVEDCAICTIQFENGVVGVSESTLASFCSPYMMELYGTQGTLIIQENSAQWATEATGGKLVPVEIPAEFMGMEKPIDQWINSCTKGTPVAFDIDAAVALTELMDGAYRAAREKRTVTLSELYQE